jgi:hypothetical protein
MQRTRWKSRVTMAAAAGLIAGVASAAVMRADLLVGQGFGAALNESRSDFSFASAQNTQRGGAVVGDEGFWLTRASADGSAPFAKPLLVGDRITISSGDGHDRQLEVTALKALAPDGTAASGNNLAQGGLMLVICHVVDGSGRDRHPVRFIVETAPAEPAAQTAPKAL